LEKQRGNMGMTWKLKAAKVAIAVGVVGALALASGADWIESLYAWLFSF